MSDDCLSEKNKSIFQSFSISNNNNYSNWSGSEESNSVPTFKSYA